MQFDTEVSSCSNVILLRCFPQVYDAVHENRWLLQIIRVRERVPDRSVSRRKSLFVLKGCAGQMKTTINDWLNADGFYTGRVSAAEAK